eukprot:CAMPEP_0205809162 /NCGR_PEP_ID=MMETSP0205-20121125/13282_1 /ASSEMBLY_ACC=CAM_ASM_000278 /TAXON_ID=36767 /ORGANISM="Euplotes focardii, Strain TN1" /LENGTH=171 /DNA_ID=CAMNT_0053085897 /DNA_START=438 /DNA_END=950 /DNA_ORIENTATION=-
MKKKLFMSKSMIIKALLTQNKIILINNQETPSVGGASSNAIGQEQDYKTLKEFEKTNKNMKTLDSKKSVNHDSVDIMDEIVKNDDIDISLGKKKNESKVKVSILDTYKTSRTTKPTQFKENEVPVFTKEEEHEYDSFAISEVQTDKSVFVLTPSKVVKTGINCIHINQTQK